MLQLSGASLALRVKRWHVTVARVSAQRRRRAWPRRWAASCYHGGCSPVPTSHPLGSVLYRSTSQAYTVVLDYQRSACVTYAALSCGTWMVRANSLQSRGYRGACAYLTYLSYHPHRPQPVEELAGAPTRPLATSPTRPVLLTLLLLTRPAASHNPARATTCHGLLPLVLLLWWRRDILAPCSRRAAQEARELPAKGGRSYDWSKGDLNNSHWPIKTSRISPTDHSIGQKGTFLIIHWPIHCFLKSGRKAVGGAALGDHGLNNGLRESVGRIPNLGCGFEVFDWLRLR